MRRDKTDEYEKRQDELAQAIRERDEAQARVKVLEDALLGMNLHFEQMQAASANYLMGKPRGIGAEEYVSAMLYLLDGPEQRKAQGAAKTALNGEYNGQ